MVNKYFSLLHMTRTKKDNKAYVPVGMLGLYGLMHKRAIQWNFQGVDFFTAGREVFQVLSISGELEEVRENSEVS